MVKEKMAKVMVDGVEYSYPQGTPYRTIAADFQQRFPHDILLVNRDGKLCELHKPLDRDCSLNMITAQDIPGIQTYERSAVFLMLKAFYDVAGRENVERICVAYSLSRALFIRAQGNFVLDQALLNRVEARMRELSAQALPIEKRSISTDDAIALFQREGLFHKAELLSFRINSHVNVYSLDGFVDYFYGYMAPDTGYIRCFGLELFESGFVLRLPTRADPARLGDFRPARKVFRELYESNLRAEALNISNVADLNTAVSRGNATPVILTYEAMMEKKIGDIAAAIASLRDVRFVMIAGPSSSGKTTFSHRLSTQLRACGLRPHAISCLTTLNIDDHNRIPSTDARLLRRIERDARTRGYSAQATIQMWPSVRRGEENNIFPFQDSADVIFNSALIYETALLKPYVQPLLFGVPRDSEEYIEAKRLLKFLNYFLPIPADNIPKTSLMREFIGGGCYHA